jgi:hypothetical protein
VARNRPSDQDWLLDGSCKTRLFEFWFGQAERDAAPRSVLELERAVGAKGPNAFRLILPRLMSLGLVSEADKKYQPVPYAQLPPGHQQMRHALEAFLAALRQL